MHYCNIPLVSPFKFVLDSQSYDIHFDDSFAQEQIKSFERRVYYRQKWQRADTTLLQIESTVTPSNLQLLNRERGVVKEFVWSPVVTATGYKIYQTLFDVTDVETDDVYFLYQHVGILLLQWKFISEPIHLKDKWKNTVKISYKNSFNKLDVAWTTGIVMNFRVEGAILDFNPDRERTAYVDQPGNVVTLEGVPSRGFRFGIAEPTGVAPYIVDLLNRIFCLDYILIENKQYDSAVGAKWEVKRITGYPLMGAAIDIVPSKNVQSLQATQEEIAPGFVVAYDIETDWFGDSNIVVPVVEVEQNS